VRLEVKLMTGKRKSKKLFAFKVLIIILGDLMYAGCAFLFFVYGLWLGVAITIFLMVSTTAYFAYVIKNGIKEVVELPDDAVVVNWRPWNW
jgi:hypothetical protein